MKQTSIEEQKIDSLILKQAVRDLASKKIDLSSQAENYFQSSDFIDLCHRLKIDSKLLQKAIKDENYELAAKIRDAIQRKEN
jgi:excinuclease UvrABC helicase subunit UvrB